MLRARLRPHHRVVVFDLGSNDERIAGGVDQARPLLAANMRAARKLAGPQRCLVVATLNPAHREPLNEFIRRFAAHNRNVVLMDWRRTIARHPEYLIDAVHSTPEGYQVRARQLVETIRRCP